MIIVKCDRCGKQIENERIKRYLYHIEYDFCKECQEIYDKIEEEISKKAMEMREDCEKQIHKMADEKMKQFKNMEE